MITYGINQPIQRWREIFSVKLAVQKSRGSSYFLSLVFPIIAIGSFAAKIIFLFITRVCSEWIYEFYIY